MKHQRGFTLLEVLVATVILGIGLATISGTLSTIVRSTALSSGYENARMLAENQIALFLAQRPLSPGEYSGQNDNATWTLTATANRELPRLLDIAVEVQFHATGGTRTVRLATAEMLRVLP